MRIHARQSGMSFWGFLLAGSVAAFFVIVGLKLMPAYIEAAKVRTALKNVAHQLAGETLSREVVVSALERRFTIDDVQRADPRKDLYIEKTPSHTTLRVWYRAEIPLFYNITALLEFDSIEELSGN